MFHLRDLPADRSTWDALFLKAMGSPDPHGRQLNGMGGGVSSLSKVCVLGPPIAAGCRPRLHVRADPGQRSARRLQRQLRQHVLGGRPFRGRGRHRACGRRRNDGAHPQHQHEEDHQLDFPRQGRARAGRGRARNSGRGRDRLARAARFSRSGRRGDRQAAADRQAARRPGHSRHRPGRGIAGRRGQPLRVPRRESPRPHGNRDARGPRPQSRVARPDRNDPLPCFGRHGNREDSRGGALEIDAADRLRLRAAGCNHAFRGGPAGIGRRPHRAHHLQRPAAPRAAADRFALHRGRGGHRRHDPASICAARKSRNASPRHALGRAYRRRGSRPRSGAWRAVRGSFFRTTRRLFEGYVYA